MSHESHTATLGSAAEEGNLDLVLAKGFGKTNSSLPS